MKLIDIKKEKPSIDKDGAQYLCIVRACGIFKEYELAEWLDPLPGEPLEGRESHEMPHFNIKIGRTTGGDYDREIMYYIELPQL